MPSQNWICCVCKKHDTFGEKDENNIKYYCFECVDKHLYKRISRQYNCEINGTSDFWNFLDKNTERGSVRPK